MAGLVPAIHAFARCTAIKTWMPATSAGMTLGLTDSLISGRPLSSWRDSRGLSWRMTGITSVAKSWITSATFVRGRPLISVSAMKRWWGGRARRQARPVRAEAYARRSEINQYLGMIP